MTIDETDGDGRRVELIITKQLLEETSLSEYKQPLHMSGSTTYTCREVLDEESIMRA